jgi:uncharacterized DUF497 family protein
MRDTARILKILKRLLRVTVDRGATANEAEIAAATARRLLDKHGLTIEQVEELRDDPDAVGEESVDSKYRRFPRWYTCLASGIAGGFECSAVSSLAGPMTFIGLRQDIAIAAYLFRTLVAELPRAAEREFCWMVTKYKASAKNNFLIGAAAQISIRLDQGLKRDPQRHALTLLKEEIIAPFVPKGTHKTSKLGKETLEADSFLRGRLHGQRVNLDGRPLPNSSGEHAPRRIAAV